METDLNEKEHEMKQSMVIKNWAMVAIPCDPHTPPELMKSAIRGDVYGHPSYVDGHHIQTSYITHVDNDNGTIETYSGSVYTIEEEDVSEKYEKEFPNAYNRIFGK